PRRTGSPASTARQTRRTICTSTTNSTEAARTRPGQPGRPDRRWRPNGLKESNARVCANTITGAATAEAPGWPARLIARSAPQQELPRLPLEGVLLLDHHPVPAVRQNVHLRVR